MQLKYDRIDIMKCRNCTEKTHCRQCGAECSDALKARGDVTDAVIDLIDQNAVIDCTDGADEDDILDALEAMGIFT